MTTVNDLMPFAGTIGSGFFSGLLAGYAFKKIIKIVGVVVGLFMAALVYLEYQRIIQVDWTLIQALSQNGITMVGNVVTHISNNIVADHMGISANLGVERLCSATTTAIAWLIMECHSGCHAKCNCLICCSYTRTDSTGVVSNPALAKIMIHIYAITRI
jgi:uncharacterized membrane protein (Fun14 family)